MSRPGWLLIALAFIAIGCPLPEMGGEGQECFDPPDQCNSGLVCVGDTCIRPECTQDHECPEGEICNREIFECRPDTNIPAQLGEPCIFGDVNAQARDCDTSKNLVCLGYVADGASGTCPSGTDGECEQHLHPMYNPDCVGGNCGGSLCCALCEGDVCPPCHWKVDLTGGGCACSPWWNDGCHPVYQDCPGGMNCNPTCDLETWCIDAGYVGPGAPCEYNDDCQVGYMCLGSGDVYTCDKLCDKNDSSTCPVGSVCFNINGVERWGYCGEDAR